MSKKNIQSVNEVAKFLSLEKLLPIYFLCGEDGYSIEQWVDVIEKAFYPLVASDFDKEVFNADKSINLTHVFDFALTFPFGGRKKLIILKNFDKVSEKKELLNYINNSADFTIFVITQSTKILDYNKEPYSTLIEKNFLFEAKPLKGMELVSWFLKTATKLGVRISEENAKAVIDLVGEQKALLEMQIQKFLNYIPNGSEISFEDIKKLSSPTKEYSIFDFLDSLGKGDKSSSLKIGINLLDAGVESVYIINMVAKFILTIAQIFDLSKQGINDNEGAKRTGTSYYYYINCKKATFFMSDERLYNASKALFNADLSIKTTSADIRTTLQILISEMLEKVVTTPYAL